MLVIGNGESRKDINIDSIDTEKVGCNAVFRDYKTIKHIICVDKRMVSEAIEADANNFSLIYTRQDWHPRFAKSKRIRIVPELPYVGSERADDPFHWGSGPYAVLLAATKADELHLIGFDLYGLEGKTNNIYKNTRNYNASEKRAVDPRYWIHQIGKVFEHFPQKKFIVYQDKDWKCPKQWISNNVVIDNLQNL